MVRAVTEDDIGLRILYDPPAAEQQQQEQIIEHASLIFSCRNPPLTNYSIVAIHGIGSHPDDTWCKNISSNPEPSQYVNWLQDGDMLPSAVPNARILRYGYESGWFGDNAIRQKASTVAMRFLLALKRERQEFPLRPLIFIAHCFGGLVVLKTLLEAQYHKDKWPGVFDSTTGLVFFGTPFRGAEGMKQSEMLEAAWREYDDTQVQAEVLRILEPGNEFLQDLVDDFGKTRSQAHKAQVACFYELKPSNVGAIVGRQARTRFVVSESSGCLDLSESTEKYSLSRTHFNMNKFGKYKEEDFLTVCEVIKGMAKMAPELILARSQYMNTSLLPRSSLVIDKCSDPTNQQKLLDKISVYNHERVHQRLCRKRLPGIGQWFLEHPNFKEWLDANGSSSLWCSGIIGSGKTMIATAVVDAAKSNSTRSGDATVYFYCENEQRNMLKATDLLASFIKQLLEHLDRIHRPRPAEVQEQILRFFGRECIQPDFDDLAVIAISLSEHMARTIYIIDGLEELDEKEVEKVLRFGSKIEKNGTRIAIFSRDNIAPYLEVPRFIPRTVHISTSNNNTKDIGLYIEIVVKDKMCVRELTSDLALMKETKQKLSQGASGMFLWVYFQIETIWATCSTNGEIRQAIENLPKGLKETYRRCLERIDNKEKYTVKVLNWISFAVRPLHIDELREAVAFDLTDKAWDSDKVPDSASLMGCCANLTVLDETDQCVRFAHPSVRQFLKSNWGDNILPYPADLRHGELSCGEFCVAYLSFSDFGLQIEKNSGTRYPMPRDLTVIQESSKIGTIVSKISRAIALPTKQQKSPIFIRLPTKPTAIANRDQYKFLRYAVENWATQTKMITSRSTAWSLFRKLAINPNMSWNFHPWMSSGQSQTSHLHGLLGWAVKEQHMPLLEIVLASESRNSLKNFFNAPIIGSSLPALHVASRFGFEDIVERLLGVCDVNAKDGEGYTAMHHSAEKGYLEVTKLLSDTRGSKVDSRSNRQRTPLSLAAINGHHQILSLLLGKRAIFNNKDGDGRTPLSVAAENGHERVVKLLLNMKADTNVKDFIGWTALSWAVRYSHEGIIKLLLDAKADVEAKIATGTPLTWAVKNGQEGIVKLLLDAKANVDIILAEGETLLLWAIGNGQERIVKLLLDAKANVKGNYTHKGMPLLLAVKYGQEGIVKLLLDTKANVEINFANQAPLLLAIENNNERVFKLLLNAKLDVESNFDSQMLLFSAVSKGREGIVKLLLDRGANIEPLNQHGETPLFRAVWKGHEPIVKLLLDRGANMEVLDESGETPLFKAVRQEYEPIIKLLLDRGANIEVLDESGEIPLFKAVQQEHEPIIKLLLDRGANMEVLDESGETPLFKAVRQEHESIIKLLLDKGANIEVSDESGETPLFTAVRNGYEHIVKLLLDKSVNMEVFNKSGETPLFIAVRNGHELIVKLLLDKDANTEMLNKSGETPLFTAIWNGHEHIVKLLFDKGANMEVLNKSGETPLFIAVRNGYELIVKLLLDKDANMEMLNEFGETPLFKAVRKGYEYIVKLLLDKGANIEASDEFDETLLFKAIRDRYEHIVKLLLDRGANMEVLNKSGDRPLFIAAFYGHEAIVRLLLDKGANCTAVNKHGDTPISQATLGGHHSIVKLLEDKIRQNELSHSDTS